MIFEEICLVGVCNRGLCYLGCIKKLEELNMINIKKYVVVSIGLFIVVCYVIGYIIDEMLDLIIEKDIKDFKDIDIFLFNGLILKGENYCNWVYVVI